MKKLAFLLTIALLLSLAAACAPAREPLPTPANPIAPIETAEGTTPPETLPETSPTIPEAPAGTEGPLASPGTSPEAGLTASAKGYGGDVTATLTMAEGNVGNLMLEGPNETEGVGKAAIETYNKTLAELKGKPLSEFDPSKLDTVSGATITSDAAKAALADVIKKAG